MHNSISLFTGAGGLDLGLHAAGFRARIAIEFDTTAVQTLKDSRNARWWSGCEVDDRPIEKIPSKELLKRARLRIGEAALLVGGPPCQPFSKSGYWHSGDAKRLADPRANTLTEYLRVLEKTLPAVFLLENVPGLAFSEKDEGIQFLRRSVASINRRKGTRYHVSAAQLNAVDFGVPQIRERVIVIGHREGREFVFPTRTHARPPRIDMATGRAESTPVDSKLEPFATAWDALADVRNEADADLAVRGRFARLLPTIPEGRNYLVHTKRAGGAGLFGWRTRYWSMLLKLRKDRPSWTLTAQPGPAIGPFHWDNRRLSATELCALQTFPSGYHIVGSTMAAHKQVGNAVPSALAEVLGLEIRRQLLGDRRVRTRPTLIPARRTDTPAPAPVVREIPVEYLPMIADHADHPGTGLGPGAARRRRTAARNVALR